MRKFIIYIILLLILDFAGLDIARGAFAGFAFNDPPAMHKPDRKKQKKGKDGQVVANPGNVSQLIEAKKEAITGNVKGAEEMLRRYVGNYPDDPVGYFELARIESVQKNLEEAVRHGREATRLDPDNKWYALFLAELFQGTANFKEAIEIYRDVVEKEPDNLDYLYQLAALYLQVEKFGDAIRVYDRIEEKAGVSEDISIQKEKIYLHQDDLAGAEKEIRNLIVAFPAESRYQSILAEFYMANNMPAKAMEVYKTIARMDPENAYIHMSMADYYRKAGNKEKAYEELKLGFANPNLDVDTKVNILLSFYNVNQIYNDLSAIPRGNEFVIGGQVVGVRPTVTKKGRRPGQEMGMITVMWSEAEFRIVVFPEAWANTKLLLVEGAPVACKVKKLDNGCHLLGVERLDLLFDREGIV